MEHIPLLLVTLPIATATLIFLARSLWVNPLALAVSGLLVKTGLYGFLRINPLFGLDTFQVFFVGLGFATAIAGLLFALSKKDMKQILAFSTVSQIGLALRNRCLLHQTRANIHFRTRAEGRRSLTEKGCLCPRRNGWFERC